MKVIKQQSLFIVLAFFLVSCSTNIPMQTTINDEILLSLDINDSIPVTYTIENKIADRSFFQYKKDANTKFSPVEEELVFNEYVVLKQMMYDFFRYRFTNQNDSPKSKIDLVLTSCTISAERTENEGVITLNSLLSRPHLKLYTAEIQVAVTVTHNGESYRRNIFGKANSLGASTEKSKSEVVAYSHVINKANNRVIHFTNQFLLDTGL